MTSPKEVLDTLEKLDFQALIGLIESEWLDAKETPYHFDKDSAKREVSKRELAKDVTALANAGGGIIVLGFDTERLQTTAGERISKVCQFPVSLIDQDQYSKILADMVHPPPHGVRVMVFEAVNGNGVAAIVVDPTLMTETPYIVGKMMDEYDVSIGSYFGFFERKRDVTPPISVARIQQQLSAGLQWSSLNDRLASIESKIDALTPPRKLATVPIPLLKSEREARIKQARIAVGRDSDPLIYFTAVSENPCRFPTLFKSPSERIARLIENPPQFRRDGFEIWADRTSVIIEGRQRRNVIVGHRLIELSEDGDFIFIGPGDEDFLGWSVGKNVGKPIHISNFVLAEATLHFCWLMRWIFEEAEPKPSVLRLAVGFANLKRTAGPATLSSSPEGRMRMMSEPKAAPSSDREVYQLAEWDTYDPARMAYLLLEDIYHWFGFESEAMPYVDESGRFPIIDAKKLIDKPLPTDPPPTPGYG